MRGKLTSHDNGADGHLAWVLFNQRLNQATNPVLSFSARQKINAGKGRYRSGNDGSWLHIEFSSCHCINRNHKNFYQSSVSMFSQNYVKKRYTTEI